MPAADVVRHIGHGTFKRLASDTEVAAQHLDLTESQERTSGLRLLRKHLGERSLGIVRTLLPQSERSKNDFGFRLRRAMSYGGFGGGACAIAVALIEQQKCLLSERINIARRPSKRFVNRTQAGAVITTQVQQT